MQSTSVILFGATGDLAQQKLFPTLYKLISSPDLPQNLIIVAIGRRPYSEEEFKNLVRENLGKKVELSEAGWNSFAQHILYYQMDFTQADAYPGLGSYLEKLEGEKGVCNRLFYLSVPPESYHNILKYVYDAGLHHQSPERWRRIVVEKPFGYNLESARLLNEHIQQLFSEDQVYRIDHYLSKETVQNILAFRFANGIFEPLWNSQHVDHIQITVAEEEGIKNRAAYYDAAGAFRDFVQNHIFQLLALLTMEEPLEFTFKSLSDEKAKVLRQLQFDSTRTVFGQYEGYLQEANVPADSQTETYAMTTCSIDSNRWAGVPFYVRTGKKLPRKISEISIQFKVAHQHLFEHMAPEKQANVLTFRLQPDEGISLRLGVKTPRHSMEVQAVQMEFCYGSAFRMELPDAYERLFFDVLVGNQSQVLREDIIEASWKVVDEILAFKQTQPVLRYAAGSWGPDRADEIMAADGRRWLAHESTVCNGVVMDNVA